MQSVSVLHIAVPLGTGELSTVDGPEPGPHSSSALYRPPLSHGNLITSDSPVRVREDAISNRTGLFGEN